MNRIYRLVWNRTLGALQVASELARSSQGGSTAGAADRASGTALRPLPRALFSLLGLAPMTMGGMALLASGTASALPLGSTYTVTQATDDGTGTTVGSLSWAIQQANADPGSIISIVLASGNTIDVSGPLPTITAATTIDDASNVTVNGVLLGSAPVTLTGAGTLSLTGNGSSLTSGMTLTATSAVLGGTGASVSTTGANGSNGAAGSAGSYGSYGGRYGNGGSGGSGSVGGSGNAGSTAISGTGFTLTGNGTVNGGRRWQWRQRRKWWPGRSRVLWRRRQWRHRCQWR